jgi:hypothetical protein
MRDLPLRDTRRLSVPGITLKSSALQQLRQESEGLLRSRVRQDSPWSVAAGVGALLPFARRPSTCGGTWRGARTKGPMRTSRGGWRRGTGKIDPQDYNDWHQKGLRWLGLGQFAALLREGGEPSSWRGSAARCGWPAERVGSSIEIATCRRDDQCSREAWHHLDR